VGRAARPDAIAGLPAQAVQGRRLTPILKMARREVPSMSLRTVHLIFILIVIISAEMFGARELYQYRMGGETSALVLGLVALAGGLIACVYAFYFVRKMDEADIH
jgi:hypothetical protein